MVNKEWINEHGEGHWLVTYGNVSVSCDDNELEEVIEELTCEAA